LNKVQTTWERYCVSTCLRMLLPGIVAFAIRAGLAFLFCPFLCRVHADMHVVVVAVDNSTIFKPATEFSFGILVPHKDKDREHDVRIQSTRTHGYGYAFDGDGEEHDESSPLLLQSPSILEIVLYMLVLVVLRKAVVIHRAYSECIFSLLFANTISVIDFVDWVRNNKQSDRLCLFTVCITIGSPPFRGLLARGGNGCMSDFDTTTSCQK